MQWKHGFSMGDQMTEKQKESIRRGLKLRMNKLAMKLSFATQEVLKYKGNYNRVGKTKFWAGGIQRHWARMAKRSMMATRKKIYATEQRLKAL